MYRVKALPVPRQAGSERKRALVELLAKVEAGGGWVDVRPDLFETRNELYYFLTGTKRAAIKQLKNLITQEEAKT